MRNEKLTPVQRVIFHEVMFKLGIIPMETPDMDVGRVLKQLPDDEARKVKRKFRKLWRKLVKKEHQGSSHWWSVEKGMPPNRNERRFRKKLVWMYVNEHMVEPIIEKFEKQD